MSSWGQSFRPVSVQENALHTVHVLVKTVLLNAMAASGNPETCPDEYFCEQMGADPDETEGDPHDGMVGQK